MPQKNNQPFYDINKPLEVIVRDTETVVITALLPMSNDGTISREGGSRKIHFRGAGAGGDSNSAC